MTSKPPELAGLVDAPELAIRLGVSLATIRSWRKRGVPWLPKPIGKIDGLVWRAEDLQGIEERMASRTAQSSAEIQAQQRRAKGAYYTPNQAAEVLAEWLVRGPGERYLEPSFGDGAFISAVNLFSNNTFNQRPNWIAYELDSKVAGDAIKSGLLLRHDVVKGDYLADGKTTPVDAVIANPPFVRLRNLPKPQVEAAQAANLSVTGSLMASSGSVWMPFLAKMTTNLTQGGRMAVVLPLDFTYVAYARSMWQFIAKNFSSIRIVRIHDRVFPDINQDVMILLADGYGGNTKSLRFEACNSVQDFSLGRFAVRSTIKVSDVVEGERAFQLALLKPELQKLIRTDFGGCLDAAGTLGNFRIGYVAGDKAFFHPLSKTVGTYRLPKSSLFPSMINARKMRGHGLHTSKMSKDVADLLWLPGEKLSVGEKSYIDHGVASGVSSGYKCAIREPWYKVPGVRTPDAILTVFSETPLLVVNDAGFFASNSLLCFYLLNGSVESFVQRWYTPLTLLSIGLQVHSLGGGVMVMVPNEAASVKIPRLAENKSRIKNIEYSLTQGDIVGAYESGNAETEALIGRRAMELVYEGIETLKHWRAR